MTTETQSTLTGFAAIAEAERTGRTLGKHADPTESAREGITVEEARAIAADDPSLIYLATDDAAPPSGIRRNNRVRNPEEHTRGYHPHSHSGVRAAIAHLDGILATRDGHVAGAVYRDDATGRWHAAPARDLADLGRRLAAGEQDAYSRWCAETSQYDGDTPADAAAREGWTVED